MPYKEEKGVFMNTQENHYLAKLGYEVDSADLFSSLENETITVVVDARKAFAYEEEHIPGAVNLPHREMNEHTTAHLDRNKHYIVYCDGIGCNASTKGALRLTQLGFKVKELIGGLDWWKRDGYATQGKRSKEGIQIRCAC